MRKPKHGFKALHDADVDVDLWLAETRILLDFLHQRGLTKEWFAFMNERYKREGKSIRITCACGKCK